jgi:hypothetical protein
MLPIEGLLEPAVTALIGGGAVAGGRRVIDLIKERRPLKKLFPFDKKHKVWIVLSEVPAQEEGEFFNKASPIDGVYSFGYLSDNLQKIGLSRQQFDVRFSSEFFSGDKELDHCKHHLILIGGYENNFVSKRINARFRDERSFYLENNQIKEWRGGKNSWGVKVDPANPKHIIKDYCLVTKMRNWFCPTEARDSWVLSFEGVREFGTLGAVKYWNKHMLKRLGFRVQKDDELEMVMEIDVDYSSGTPEVKLPADSIKSAYWKGSKVKL